MHLTPKQAGIHVRELPIPPRLVMSLLNAGIHTLNDIAKYSDKDLLMLYRFGPKSVRDLRESIDRILEPCVK